MLPVFNYDSEWRQGDISEPDLIRPICYARETLNDYSDEQITTIINDLRALINNWASKCNVEPGLFISVSDLPESIKYDLVLFGEHIDLPDLLSYMISVEMYQPSLELLARYNWQVVMAVLTLILSQQAIESGDQKTLVSALKASNTLSRSEIAALHLSISDKNRAAIKKSRSKHASHAALIRNAGNIALKAKAKELYLQHKDSYKSMRKLSFFILPILQNYAVKNSIYVLRGGSPFRTVYVWVLEFNKS